MPRRIEWPAEDIVLEICWNGDPDRCEVIPKEFLPDGCCENCMKHKTDGCVVGDGDLDDVCGRYEWDQETLMDEPKEPRREDYMTDKAFRKAKDCVRQWYVQYTDRFRE
jgi:hypothetical protein